MAAGRADKLRPCTLACVTLLISGTAWAHGTSVFLSTPVSPPDGFLWALLWTMAVVTVGNGLVLNRFGRVPTKRAIGSSFVAFLLFAVVFNFLGAVAAGLNTAPPPGLALGQPVFWGWSWREVGALFATTNAIGMVLFAICLMVVSLTVGGQGASRSARLAFAAAPGLYLLALTPFLLTSALASGHHGGYTLRNCDRNLAQLGGSLHAYAEDHEGRLPVGKTLTEIMPSLQPYLRERSPIFRVDLCPISAPYESNPETYYWNPELSGRALDEMEGLSGPAIACPSHRHSGHEVLAAELLLPNPEAIDSSVSRRQRERNVFVRRSPEELAEYTKTRLVEISEKPIDERRDGEAVILTTGVCELPENESAQWTARVEPYQGGSRVIIMTTRTLSKPDGTEERSTERDYREEARIVRPIDPIVANWIELGARP